MAHSNLTANRITICNTDSNHPPNIIRQLPITIEKRLSEHSSNEEIFNNAKADYEKALKDSRYQPALKFTPHVDEISQRRNRKRNIIWFNPHSVRTFQPTLQKDSST